METTVTDTLLVYPSKATKGSVEMGRILILCDMSSMKAQFYCVRAVIAVPEDRHTSILSGRQGDILYWNTVTPDVCLIFSN